MTILIGAHYNGISTYELPRLIGQKENKGRVKDPQEMEDVLKHLIEH